MFAMFSGFKMWFKNRWAFSGLGASLGIAIISTHI
jgi:hypothetical protein